MADQPIDYNALAAQNGAISSTPSPTQTQSQPPQQAVDYSVLAAQNGAISSTLPPASSQAATPSFSDIVNAPPTGYQQADMGKGLVQAGQDVWNVVKNIVQHPVDTAASVLTSGGLVGSVKDTYKDIKETIPIIQAYENARSQGKGVIDSLSAANDQAAKQNQAQQILKQRIDDFKKNPTQAATRAVGDAAAAAAAVWAGNEAVGAVLPEVGAGTADAATETAAAPEAEAAATEQPSLVQQITKGGEVAQAPAQQALRNAVAPVAEDESVAANVANNSSLRTIAEEPIANISEQASNAYKAIDEASGTDLNGLANKLDNVNYKIRMSTNPQEEAALEADRTGIINTLEDAKAQAASKGFTQTDLDAADAKFTQGKALNEFEDKILKNPSFIKGNAAQGTPETISDIDKLTEAVQKFADRDKFGSSRLEQALGKEGASRLLGDLYEAQRLKNAALAKQAIIKNVYKYGKAGAWVSGIGLALKKIAE